MSSAVPASPASPPILSPAIDIASHPGQQGLSIAILAFAAFVIVTTEFLIVGLLPALARDLGISISTAGLLVTLFAFTVMLFGPVLTVFLSHFERKRLFIVIMLVFAVSNALAALGTNIWILALARFIAALALPVFWGTASETAGQIVGPERAGRAVSQVYFGISAALLFGIPLGTLAADAVGWRGTFWGLAVLCLLMAGLLVMFMPTVARPQRVKIAEQTQILKDPHFLANVALSIVVFTAMFTSYTYLADTLERVAGVPTSQVGWWLMGFGAMGMMGNWIGGYVVDRSPLGATLVFTLLLAIGMAGSVPLAGSYGWLGLDLLIWGIAYTALFPICQVRVMKAASNAQALAGTINVSAANAGIGVGAMIGGFGIERFGIGSIGYVASGIAVVAIVMGLMMQKKGGETRNKLHK
ncbi:MFS transporter [Glaciimonas sp. Gout2]|uniref:MFS transporter n=1 Tax=unclassified Glaciimonas TaxID=2644401 RepID=UPI002B22A076|nr:MULTISPECIES: MFS transporter [unclassified Glaciimonas]MEB0010998.1 MFS transporter [Glaciimonas sp. Cout2]MEB0083271.1 MFS transporter [Glaciimonas sp. Gout2]